MNKGFDKPLSEKQIVALLKATDSPATVEQYVAARERGFRGLLEEGFTFYADAIDRLPVALRKQLFPPTKG